MNGKTKADNPGCLKGCLMFIGGCVCLVILVALATAPDKSTWKSSENTSTKPVKKTPAQVEKALLEWLVGSYKETLKDRVSEQLYAMTGHTLTNVQIRSYEHEWLSDKHDQVRMWGTASVSVFMGDGQMSDPNQVRMWSFVASKNDGHWKIQDTTQY